MNYLLLAFYVAAFWIFFSGYKRHGYSAWWLLAIVLCPWSVVVLCARTRRKTAADKDAQRAQNQVRAAVWYLVIGCVVLWIPGIVIYYNIMDGADPAMVRLVPIIQVVGLAAVTLVYGFYAGRYLFAKQQ